MVERIVWLDGSERREHIVTTDRIRSCRFGLVVNDGGPVSIASCNIILRDVIAINWLDYKMRVNRPLVYEGYNT